VRVSDETGEELLAATFADDEQGLRALCRTLLRLRVRFVAIERPDGLLVERLLDAGLRVLAMHPKRVAAARARFRAAGGKSDRFDAFVLCELARTDNHRFRVLEPDGDRTKALRALTRMREDLVHARVALSGQLRAELERFWPGPIGLFQKLDSPISLAFLERYPSPADARGLGERRLARQHCSGGQKPGELLTKLRRAPEGRVGEAELAARRALVLALVAAITPLVEQIKQLTQQIAAALREHPDGEFFLSLFRTPGSVVTAAELLAEIGDCHDAGHARRRRRPGRCRGRVRQAQDRQLPLGLQQAAAWRDLHAGHGRQDPPRHPWAADRYADARGRGHDHPRAATHRRPRLVPDRLALLARPHPL
jgi:transposase